MPVSCLEGFIVDDIDDGADHTVWRLAAKNIMKVNRKPVLLFIFLAKYVLSHFVSIYFFLHDFIELNLPNITKTGEDYKSTMSA